LQHQRGDGPRCTARIGGANCDYRQPWTHRFCLKTSPQDRRTSRNKTPRLSRPRIPRHPPSRSHANARPLLNIPLSSPSTLATRNTTPHPPDPLAPYNMAMPVLPRQPTVNALAHQEDPNWADEQKLQAQERNTTTVVQKSPKRTKNKAVDESLLRSLCTLVCDNQIGVYLCSELVGPNLLTLTQVSL